MKFFLKCFGLLVGGFFLSSCTNSLHAPINTSKSDKQVIDHYVDNGDGTVTDNKTGLMWKKCSEGKSGKNCSGKAELYKWPAAKNKFNKGASFAGYNDWRMPTIEELHSLVHCSNGVSQQEAAGLYGCLSKTKLLNNFQRPAINQTVFPNTERFSWFWSQSSLVSDDGFKWASSQDNGGYSFYSGNNAFQIRLVRNQ